MPERALAVIAPSDPKKAQRSRRRDGFFGFFNAFLERRVAMQVDTGQEQDRLRIRSLVYGGLIVIGVYMVQPFLTAASLDLSATVCVIAFSVAIPLLAALVVIDRQQAYRRRRAAAALVAVAQLVAQWSAFAGVVAGFWHITWVAGVAVLASGLVGTLVVSVGYMRPGPLTPSRP
jgi:O-antigen/teichoic acid export membrane protein